MNKLLTILFIATISSTSAFAKGLYCESAGENEEGQTYVLEAVIQDKALNVLQLSWEIKDDRGHADEYETILEDQLVKLVESYKPVSEKFQGYAKYQVTTGDHSLQKVEIFIPKKLGSKKQFFTGYVKVVDEHAGLVINEALDCKVNE